MLHAKKLLKLAKVSRSYSKNNTGTVFLRQGVRIRKHFALAVKLHWPWICFDEGGRNEERVSVRQIITIAVPLRDVGVVERTVDESLWHNQLVRYAWC